MKPGCAQCKLDTQCESPRISGRGELDNPKLVLIGECPGKTEDKNGEVFIGRAGELLTSLLGDKLPFVFITNAVKCCVYRDPFTRKETRNPTEFEVEMCRPFLFKELKAFDPEKVTLMPMGKIAYYGLFGENPLGGIVQASGVEKKVKIDGLEFRVVPNVHPAYLLRNPEMEGKFLGILERAFNRDKIFEKAVWKILRPEEGIERLEWILENKELIGYVVLDLETSSFDPWNTEIIMVNFAHHLDYTAYSLPLKVTNHIHHADYPYEVPIIDWGVSSVQYRYIKKLVSDIVNSIPLVNANLKFDLKCLVLQGWIKDLSKVKVLDDTMILTHLIYNQRLGNLKLKDSCRALFDVREEWDRKVQDYLKRFKLVKDRTFDKIPTGILGEYGALDVFYTRKLHEHLLENLPDRLRHLRDFMMPLVLIIAEAEINGWALDTEMYEFLSQKYREMIVEISKKIRSFEPVEKYISAKKLVLDKENLKKKNKWSSEQIEEMAFNIASSKQLSDIMYGPKFFNFPIIRRTDKGAASTNYETLIALKKEKLTDLQKDFINHLLDFRTISKLKNTYIDPVMEHVVNGSYKLDTIIPGTVTGRLCLTGDTKISLLNGQEVRIDELPVNKQIYVYGCSIDGTILPVEAVSLGETKKVTTIVEILLDNNETVKCTPDHKFMLRDGSYKEAQFLTSEDSLMPLYRKVSSNGLVGYELYLDNKTGKWKYTHSMVGKIVWGIKEVRQRCLSQKKECPKCGGYFVKQSSYIGHKVLSIKTVILSEPIPVYDICCPATNNFALSSGIFVHNSSGFHTIPRGSDIKRMYTSQWRDIGGLIMSGDMSQIELRILATLAKETKMIDAFIRGDDIHSLTAAQIFQKPWDRISKSERSVGKCVNFAIIYGKTALTLKDDLNVTIQRAQEIIDNLLSGYEKVAQWFVERHKEVMATGSVKTVFGREIPIPERYMEKRSFQSEAFRKSQNYPIQCLEKNTLIPLVSGEIKTIAELSLEGKEQYLYCYDFNNNKISISKGVKFFKSGEVCELVRVCLDNGNFVQCTRDHLFLLRNREYKTASDLTVGDSLMPFDVRISKKGYKQVFDFQKVLSLRKWNDFFPYISRNFNCKVIKIENIIFDKPEPVYDIEVPEFHNFAIYSGVFVHNSTASDLVKSSLVRYCKKVKNLKLKSKFLGESHDALNNDLYPGDLFMVLKLLKDSCESENMEIYKDWLICPLKVDVSLGVSMGSTISFEIKELRDDFALLEGEGLRSDWKQLIEVGSRGYHMKFYLDEEVQIDPDSYMIEQVIRDEVSWKGKLEVKKIH